MVNALRFFDATRTLVFCRTRAAVSRLHGNLVERGFAAVALSGELTQAERNRALQGLRDGRARVCVATDVAARGIDLPDLGLVIHAELPVDPETLLHRSGRTGRAGRKGISALLVPHTRRRAAERLLAAARVKAVWAPAPNAEAIRARDNERIAGGGAGGDGGGSGGGRARPGARPPGRAIAGGGGRRADEAPARAAAGAGGTGGGFRACRRARAEGTSGAPRRRAMGPARAARGPGSA